MKHLRKFNESQTEKQWFLELNEFCENNLAYLLDEGFSVFTKPSHQDKKAVQIWFKPDGRKITHFKWNEIKDHFIPFLIRLDKEYNLYSTDHSLFKEQGKSILLQITMDWRIGSSADRPRQHFDKINSKYELTLNELEDYDSDDLNKDSIRSIAIVIQRP